MMTEQEAAALRAWGEELAGAAESIWQPGCVCRAFMRTDAAFIFRMQTWIDLEAVESPFLLERMPEAEEAIWHFEVAFRAFGYDGTTPEACDPEELLALGDRMLEVIREGFAMRLRLAPAEGKASARGGDGMGNWLPILAALKSQLQFALGEALRLPVGQAFALLAAHRCNEGWRVVGDTYASRDVPDETHDGGHDHV